MVKPEFWWWGAARAEIDQRARDARLRLEHLERRLILRVPTRSRPKRVVHRRGLAFFRGGCVPAQSTKVAQHGQARRFPTEVCIAARGATPFRGRVPQ
jgi:hypothetical protein